MQDFLKGLMGHFAPSEHNAYRPHLLRKQWLLFFLSVTLTAEGLFVASYFASESAQIQLSAVVPGEIVALTNVERGKVGDGALAENGLLDAAAQAKADDMAAKGYFSHVGPDGKEPWAWIAGAGYSYAQAGENLAVRFDNSSDVVNAWMASPTHKANIVKPAYKEIGVGVANGIYEGAPATFVVQYFGTPQSGVAAATPASPAIAEQAPAASNVAGASTDADQDTATHAPTTTAPQASTPAPEAKTDAAPQSDLRSELQSFLRASEASQDTTRLILGGIATLLVLVIALTIFVHIEIQPTEMVLGGVFVAAVAVSFFMLNSSFTASENSSQSAAAANASYRSILMGEGAQTQAQ